MKKNSMTTPSLIACHFLSSAKILEKIRSNNFSDPLKKENVRETLYLAHHPWAAREPDHVFYRAWEVWQKEKESNQKEYVQIALRTIADEFITARHGELRVRLENFGVWQQSLLSRLSSLPIQAAAYLWRQSDSFINLPNKSIEEENSKHTHCLLLPYDSLVEEYFRREGLHETHLHLNGSTHAELCWLRALKSPQEETNSFCKKLDRDNRESTRLREMVQSIQPDFSARIFQQQLTAARALRSYLIAAATNSLNIADELPQSLNFLYNSAKDYSPSSSSEAFISLINLNDCSTKKEIHWLFKLLEKLEKEPSPTLANMLHSYILIKNLYYRLLVQGEEQYGFDQFQKMTWTDLREPAEFDYFSRFCSIHGPHKQNSRVIYLEGRFSPKNSTEGNLEIINRILNGYLRYISNKNTSNNIKETLHYLEEAIENNSFFNTRRIRLALVAHFIKQPEPIGKTPYRFYELRKNLNASAHALRESLCLYPKLRRWVRGIDAAANELDTPPEVFASAYRISRRAGLTRRTFHAGEDFHHILGGMRIMLDALEILDLKEGDRIGHGTAMGIDPELWLNRTPSQSYIRKDEWMLDLLATWRLLEKAGETRSAYKIASDLTELASELFDEEVTLSALERSMRLRGLNIFYLEKLIDTPPTDSMDFISPLQDDERFEALQVEKAVKKSRRDCNLLWRWSSDPEVRDRGSKLQAVDSHYLSADQYIKVQQSLMKEIKERRVLIETLPSSNVRISQYQSFDEHHSFRWMRIPKYLKEGDPEIMVTLGSDDPGIFASELAGEFYQLYAVLRGKGFSDKESLYKISALNERGREYRFHDLEIG